MINYAPFCALYVPSMCPFPYTSSVPCFRLFPDRLPLSEAISAGQLMVANSVHDPAWCAAVIMFEDRVVEEQMISGTATSPYVPGLMALRLGPLMEQAVRALSASPDVLLLDGTA
jgi:hypothetical protein